MARAAAGYENPVTELAALDGQRHPCRVPVLGLLFVPGALFDPGIDAFLEFAFENGVDCFVMRDQADGRLYIVVPGEGLVFFYLVAADGPPRP